VWLVDLDIPEDPVVRMVTILSPDESDRAGPMRSPRDGRRRALRRSCLRVILSGYLGRPPATLRFRSLDCSAIPVGPYPPKG